MNTFFASTLLTTILAAAVPVGASTIPFYFGTPPGTLGVSQSYVAGGVTITARGYSGLSAPSSAGTPVALYGKNGGGDETGLGIAAGADREILNDYFIQVDFSGVKSTMTNPSAQLMIGSVQAGESYNIYGSNSIGVAGTLLIERGTLDDKFFAVPSLSAYSYFSISAPKGNVLLDAVSLSGPSAPAPVPEPSTVVLFAGAALTSIGFSRRLRRALRPRGELSIAVKHGSSF